MGYFKRFTDGCATFGALFVLIFVFSKFMGLKELEQMESTSEKLKYFLNGETSVDYRPFVILFVLLAVSVTISTVLHKFPQYTAAVSAIPLIYTVQMFVTNRLFGTYNIISVNIDKLSTNTEDRLMIVMMILFFLHTSGCIYECIRRDRIDRGHRAAIATDILGGVTAIISVATFFYAKNFKINEDDKLGMLDTEISGIPEDGELNVFIIVALIFVVLSVIRFLLKDIYFIDAILALAALVTVAYMWGNSIIPAFGAILTVLAAVYFLARLFIMLSCRPKIDDTEIQT